MQIGSDIDIYATASTPKFAVGTGFERADGSRFRYVHVGADLEVGEIGATDASESDFQYLDNVGATVAGLTDRSGENLSPNAAGSRYLQLIITATDNQFDGGYLAIQGGAGAGYTYRIRSHTITTDNDPTTGNIYMDLYDKVHTAIDSTSDICIAGSPYSNLEPTTGEAHATTTDIRAVGVACAGISAQSYGWVQTKGPCGVLQDANIALSGQEMTLSSNTAGACMATPYVTTTPSPILAAQLRPTIGHCIVAGSSGTYTVVHLALE